MTVMGHNFKQCKHRIYVAPDSICKILSALLDQRPTDCLCGLKIIEYGVINLPQIAPWILIPVEAVQKQHVGQKAEHPIHVGGVPDNRA